MSVILTRKIMLLGDIGVGKTSIVRRFVLDSFDGCYKATIGVDIYTKEVEVSCDGASSTIKFVIWDIDGDFDDSIFNHVYSKGASAAFIIGDATRSHTHETMMRLYDGFQEHLPGRPAAFILNKVDLAPQDYASNLPGAFIRPQIPLILTSAKTGENISHAFHELAEMIVLRDV